VVVEDARQEDCGFLRVFGDQEVRLVGHGSLLAVMGLQ
jgi:hypothetical protein